MMLSFPTNDSRPFPVLATGRVGLGDILRMRFVRPGVVRFGYDHWGSGLSESDDVPVSEGKHTLKIYMPSLLAPGTTPEAIALGSSLRLFLDGQIAWAQSVPFNPVTPDEIYFGENKVGASSSELEFPGVIYQVSRLPEDGRVLPAAKGPIRLRLQLPRDRLGRYEPLVVTGVTGRADLLSIHYADADHVRFAFDHWGGSFKEGPPAPVEFSRAHEIEVRMPSLDWPQPADGGIFQGTVEILVDGAIAWRTPEEFYRAASGSLEIAANRIGGSSCDTSFTGGIIGIDRPGSGAPSGRP
jgi:hypothetical protein